MEESTSSNKRPRDDTEETAESTKRPRVADTEADVYPGSTKENAIPLLWVVIRDSCTSGGDAHYFCPLDMLEETMRKADIPVQATDYLSLRDALDERARMMNGGNSSCSRWSYRFAKEYLKGIDIRSSMHLQWDCGPELLSNEPLRLLNQPVRNRRDGKPVWVEIKYGVYL